MSLCECSQCKCVNEGAARFCYRCGSPLAVLGFERDLLRGLEVGPGERREFPLLFRNSGGGTLTLVCEVLDRPDWALLRSNALTLPAGGENTLFLHVNAERMQPGRRHRGRLRVRSEGSAQGRRTGSDEPRRWDRWCREERDFPFEVEVTEEPVFACNRRHRRLGDLGRTSEYSRMFRIGNVGGGVLDIVLEPTQPFVRLPRAEFRLARHQTEDLPVELVIPRERPLNQPYEAGIVVREQRSRREIAQLGLDFWLRGDGPDLPVLGIDFGTSSSKVALLGGAEVVQIDLDGKDTFPSHVYVHEDGRLEVGEEAARFKGLHGYLLNLKSLLSRDEPEGPAPVVRLRGQEYLVSDLVRDFLRRLFRKAAGSSRMKELLPGPVRPEDVRLTLTVPAGSEKRWGPAMNQILRDLGFRDQDTRVLVESTAVSFLYASNDSRIVEGTRILVFDCGAGTTDVSVLRARLEREEREGYYYRVFDILAEEGEAVGGNRFDEEIYKLVHERMTTESKKALERELKNQMARKGEKSHRLLDEVRKLKELVARSWHDTTRESFPLSVPGLVEPELIFTREDLSTRLRPVLKKLEDLCHDALKKAGLHAEDVDVVYLVGGSTFLPQIESQIRKMFSADRVHADADRLTSVARGAVASASTRLRKVLSADYLLKLQDGREVELVRRGTLYPIAQAARNLLAPPDLPFELDMLLMEREPGLNPVPVGAIRLYVKEAQNKTNRISVLYEVDAFGDLSARAVYDPGGANVTAEMVLVDPKEAP